MNDLPAVGEDRTVSLRFAQTDYDEFARISGDANPIHVDPAFSARTRFGRTVAHGMFLFATLSAELARWVGGPLHVLDQQLMFTAPTFADDDVGARLEIVERDAGQLVVAQQMRRGDGEVVTHGRAIVSRLHEPPPAPERPGPAGTAGTAEHRGLRRGMRAIDARTFSSDDVAAYRRLVGDPNPLFAADRAEVPPALIGGVVSCLLGVDLPGPGTNWLKQHYRFHQPLRAGTELRTQVEITRIRHEKALVDLADRAETDGGVVMTGDTLVLAADVAPRTA